MQFNKLIPELSVSDLNKSLDFYIGILGFKIEYERKKFFFLSFQESQIMLDEDNNNENSPWYTGKLEYPRGRGIHFQFEVDSIEPLLEKLKEKKWPIKVKPKIYEFRKEKEIIKMRGFLVMDPDGYLLMFNEIK
jgi:catechol 2,3-dioxygenase-like lactoylglutathione lyase family enzyme